MSRLLSSVSAMSLLSLAAAASPSSPAVVASAAVIAISAPLATASAQDVTDDIDDDFEDDDDDFDAGDDLDDFEDFDDGFEDTVGELDDDFGDFDDSIDDDLDDGFENDLDEDGDDFDDDDDDFDDDDDEEEDDLDDDDRDDDDDLESDDEESGRGLDTGAAISLDEQGYPARPSELLAFNLNDDDLAIARDLGFEVLERRELRGVGATIDRLGTPGDLDTRAAAEALEEAAPAAPFDYNHIYHLPEGETTDISDTNAGLSIGGSQSGIGVKIGVIDTMVDVNHPSLVGRSVTVRDFAEAGGRDQQHGTAIASILVGHDERAAYRGLLPGADLFAANVFSSDKDGRPQTSAFAMLEALDWIADQDVGIINVSIAGPDSAVLSAMIDVLAERGQIVVAAVGNDGPAAPPVYPAAYDGVVGVTAIDMQDKVYRRAGRGGHVDFSAPGVRVRAAHADGGYAFMTGTSFATPVVAGLLASEMPNPTPNAALQIDTMQARTRDIGAPGRDDTYGHGLLQTRAVLDK